MKKKIVSILVAGMIFMSFPSPVMADGVDEASAFLEKYQSENNSFLIEEHCSTDNTTKTLFIQENMSHDAEDDKYMDFANNEKDILREMSTKDWFDYESIYLLKFVKDTGKVFDFRDYNVSEGALISYGYENVIKLPWIIKEKDELEDSVVIFLINVTKEILRNSANDYLESDPGEIDNSKIRIKESNGIAEVGGNIDSSGNEYEFLVQFTYEIDDNMDGTYNTLYAGLNDVSIYGEYNDISNIRLN